MKREFGTQMGVDYRSKIECIDKPYAFIKFERQITKKKSEYRDFGSNKQLMKLNESLGEVQDIMRKNIDDLLLKGENLEQVGSKASALRDQSDMFRKNARYLSLQALVKQYAVLGIVGLFILLILGSKLGFFSSGLGFFGGAGSSAVDAAAAVGLEGVVNAASGGAVGGGSAAAAAGGG